MKLTSNVNTQKSNINLQSIPLKTVTLKLRNRSLKTINLMFHLNILDFRYQPSIENNLKNINYEESFCERLTNTELYLGVIEKRYLINLKNGKIVNLKLLIAIKLIKLQYVVLIQIFVNNNNLLKFI